MSGVKRVGRRAFLIGAGGATLALPLLRYTQGRATAEGGPVAKRLIVYFSHGGTIMSRMKDGSFRSHVSSSHHGYNDWAPADPGEELVLGPIMEPLGAAGLGEYLLLPQAVDNMAGQTQMHGGGHGSANVSALTAERWDTEDRVDSGGNTYTTRLPHGPSIDQVIAQRLQMENPTPFTSVDLSVYGHGRFKREKPSSRI